MTNLPIMTHSALTDDPASKIKKTKMPTLEKWMWIYTDDDFSGLPLFGCDDDSWQQWPGLGPGPAPGLCVPSGQVSRHYWAPTPPAGTIYGLGPRLAGPDICRRCPEVGRQEMCRGAAVQRAARRAGTLGAGRDHRENHASPEQPGRESLISGNISSEAVNNKKISQQSNGGTIKF